MYEVVRTTKKVQVFEDDVISLDVAAQISGRAVSVIANMLDRGRLPWLQYRPRDTVAGERIQRFTSRRAVMALPAMPATRGRGRPARAE